MVTNRTHSKHVLLLVTALCVCGLAAGVSSALATPGTFTWNGNSGSSIDWSDGGNWTTTAPSVSDGTSDALVFPPGVTGNCSTEYGCLSEDDIPLYTVNSLTIDDGSDYFIGPDNANDPLTIESGGISADTSLAAFDPSTIYIPLTLGAGQTWTINGGPDGNGQLNVVGGVSGNTDALAVDLSSVGFLDFDLGSDNEVGAVTATSAVAGDAYNSYLNGAVELGNGAQLNATDGNSITVHDADLLGDGTIGPLISQGGLIGLGDPTGSIAVNGSVSLDDESELVPLIISAGTTAGTDYSQLTATGSISLGGSELNIQPGNLTGDCPTLDLGAVYTLVSAPTISGTFANVPASGYNVDLDCTGAEVPYFKMSYNNSVSPHTVTATVGGPGATTETYLEPPANEYGTLGGPEVMSAYALSSNGGQPAGTIEFTDNGVPIPGCASQPMVPQPNDPIPDSLQFASCTMTAQPAGTTYALQAIFNPTDDTTDGNGVSGSASPVVSGTFAGVAPSVAPSVAAPAPDTATFGQASTKNWTASSDVSCQGATDSSCPVSLSLSVLETLKGGKVIAVAAKTKTTQRTVNVGSTTTTVGANGSATVAVTLNSAGKALLKGHHTLAVKLTCETGTTVLGSQTVTFKYPTKK